MPKVTPSLIKSTRKHMVAYKRISVQQARQMMDEQEAVVVDIRDEQSFANGHITSSAHLDNAGVQQFINEADLESPVIVCCYHGNSSQPAAAYLIEQGFEDVSSLDGGFEEWKNTFPDLCSRQSESST